MTYPRRTISLAAIFVLTMARWSPAQVNANERALLDRINVDRALALIRRLSEEVVTTTTGAGKGTAVAGSPEERALADVIERELKSAGIEVRQERFPVRAYTYGPVTLTANGTRLEAISLHSAGGTWGARDGVDYRSGNRDAGRRLEAHLADAGDGGAADYLRAGDVRGKIVLVRRGGAWPTYQILEAATQGAAGLLIFDYANSREDTLKQDSMWYHDQLPTASITRRDGERLRQLLTAGPVTVSLENRVDVADGTSQNVVGTIRGSELPDEWVAVTAHYDRWFTGAQDNSVGAASVVELARVFAGTRPRRSMLFIATGSEETGIEATESDWMAGSHAFVSAHPDITRRLAFAFNIDGGGWPAAKGYLHATIDNVPFQRQILADLSLTGRLDVRANISSSVDGWNMGIVGGGAVAYVNWREGRPDAPDLFAPLYHTQADIFEPARFGNLIHDLSVGALSMARIDRASLLPVSFVSVADTLAAALESDAARAGDVSFAPARQAMRAFREVAMQAEGGMAGAEPDEQRQWSRRLMRTRKELMPWLLGRGGGGTLKTSAYAGDLQALSAARAAASRGDRAATLAALERTGGVRQAARYSDKTVDAERLYWYSSGDWSVAYDQKGYPVSLEALAIYRRLTANGEVMREAGGLAQLEAEVRGRLRDTVFLIAGKLNAATAALQRGPTDPTGGSR